MEKTQESKYDAVNGKIVNRATGIPIPNDEPIIIFRAKDIHLRLVLKTYQTLIKDPHHLAVIERKLKDVIEWQGKNINVVKEPDSDESCLK